MKPRIVCLCGSTRFYSDFQRVNYRETMAGNIVLSVGFYPHSSEIAHGQTIGITPQQKIALDELHKRKIDLSDEICVINVNGYVGESTRSEIDYAIVNGKAVRYEEPPADETGSEAAQLTTPAMPPCCSRFVREKQCEYVADWICGAVPCYLAARRQ